LNDERTIFWTCGELLISVIWRSSEETRVKHGRPTNFRLVFAAEKPIKEKQGVRQGEQKEKLEVEMEMGDHLKGSSLASTIGATRSFGLPRTSFQNFHAFSFLGGRGEKTTDGLLMREVEYSRM
jgi:hypothetical protein